ncbi:Ribonuclease H-like domain [Phytophthora cactorum]|nr:Ribonuclease H-like domain [Phytophthora cactorum]
MDLAPRPRHATFTPTQVTRFYFRPCRDANDEIVSEYFRCRCGTARKQTRRNGYSNLMQHVRREHPDYEVVMLTASTAETDSLLNYVRRSALNVFGWLDWIIKNGLPLHFCKNPAARRYSNLDPICVETLQRAMESLTRSVERYIAAEMPERVGFILDGWSHASEHFVAVFACYEVDGVMKTPLLCMAPLLNDPDEDLSARGHLAGMQPRDYGKQLSDCSFVVGDNCAVNRLLATLMGVPLVGCASHRLNRAVQVDMEQYEDDLACDQALMMLLRTLKQSAKLRLKTSLRPVIRQDTRWSSTFSTVHRYFKLLEHLDPTDDAIVDVLPAPPCNKRLLSLLKDLKKVESVPKALQGASVTLLDVRVWFDGLIAVKPHYARFLGTRADIVHNPDFESESVRVIGGSPWLTRAEKEALQPFRCVEEEPPSTKKDSSLADSKDEGSFVENLQKRRRLAAVEPRYDLLSCIPPTSKTLLKGSLALPGRRTGKSATVCSLSHWKWCYSCCQSGEYWTAQTVDEATR